MNPWLCLTSRNLIWFKNLYRYYHVHGIICLIFQLIYFSNYLYPKRSNFLPIRVHSFCVWNSNSTPLIYKSIPHVLVYKAQTRSFRYFILSKLPLIQHLDHSDCLYQFRVSWYQNLIPQKKTLLDRFLTIPFILKVTLIAQVPIRELHFLSLILLENDSLEVCYDYPPSPQLI